MKPADASNHDILVDNEEQEQFHQGAPGSDFGGFSEKTIRLAFIRKVYWLVTLLDRS